MFLFSLIGLGVCLTILITNRIFNSDVSLTILLSLMALLFVTGIVTSWWFLNFISGMTLDLLVMVVAFALLRDFQFVQTRKDNLISRRLNALNLRRVTFRDVELPSDIYAVCSHLKFPGFIIDIM